MKNKLKQFSEYMFLLGATQSNNKFYPYEFEIETIYGPLRVSIHKNNFTKQGKPRAKFGNLVSIFTCFIGIDFDRFKEYLKQKNGNTYSSKINYHLSGGESVEENWNANFDRFKNDLEKILVKSEN